MAPTGGGLFGYLGRGTLGNAFGFAQIMRELDPGDVERQLARTIRLLATATSSQSADWLADALGGESASANGRLLRAVLEERSPVDDAVDVALVVVESGENGADRLSEYRRQYAGRPSPVVLVLRGPAEATINADTLQTEGVSVVRDSIDDEVAFQHRLALAVVELISELALPLARAFPFFRAAVAERLIRDASRANGQFALLSSVPAMIPIVGGAASGIADTALLTKNQGLLVYKLAGIYGRDLSDRVGLAIEIAPVIGGAFVWRSIARTLIGFVPGVVGGLPKAAVAFAGTYSVGQMARYYYSTGQRPGPELVSRFQADGARLAADLYARIRQLRRGEAGRS